METISNENHIRGVRKALSRLPDDLPQLYHDTLSRIRNTTETKKQLAIRVLLWVVHSFRPLRVGELQEAIAMAELSEEKSDTL
jgi:hypothetical protein